MIFHRLLINNWTSNSIKLVKRVLHQIRRPRTLIVLTVISLVALLKRIWALNSAISIISWSMRSISYHPLLISNNMSLIVFMMKLNRAILIKILVNSKIKNEMNNIYHYHLWIWKMKAKGWNSLHHQRKNKILWVLYQWMLNRKEFKLISLLRNLFRINSRSLRIISCI